MSKSASISGASSVVANSAITRRPTRRPRPDAHARQIDVGLVPRPVGDALEHEEVGRSRNPERASTERQRVRALYQRLLERQHSTGDVQRHADLVRQEQHACPLRQRQGVGHPRQ
jgi:hypothetical protein